LKLTAKFNFCEHYEIIVIRFLSLGRMILLLTLVYFTTRTNQLLTIGTAQSLCSTIITMINKPKIYCFGIDLECLRSLTEYTVAEITSMNVEIKLFAVNN